MRVLAKELEVAPGSVMAAIRLLENEGFFIGYGRARRIAPVSPAVRTRKVFRFGILPRIAWENESAPIRNLFGTLSATLKRSGAEIFHTPRTILELETDPDRVAAMISKMEVDAWIVIGATTPILRTLISTGRPVFAFASASIGVDVAGTGFNFNPDFLKLVRRLLKTGHERIVCVCPQNWIHPVPRTIIRDLRAELKAAGIVPGEFNTPKWEETPEATLHLFHELFQVTPPTAMIFLDYRPVLMLQNFLMQRGLSIPHDVSVACMQIEETETWLTPRICHFAGDLKRLEKNLLKWVSSVMLGKDDRTLHLVETELVPGESLGVAPGFRAKGIRK